LSIFRLSSSAIYPSRRTYAENALAESAATGSIAAASPNFLSIPTPTVAASNKAYLSEIEVVPTSNPSDPLELFKRLSADPAICGWVEGDASP